MKTAFDKGAKYVSDGNEVWMSDSGFYLRMSVVEKVLFLVQIHSVYPANDFSLMVDVAFYEKTMQPFVMNGEFAKVYSDLDSVKSIRKIASALNLAATIAADVSTYRLIYQSECDRINSQEVS